MSNYVLSDHVLRTTLSLYMEDHYEHPLPTPEEVLICNSTTNAEEVCLQNELVTFVFIESLSTECE